VRPSGYRRTDVFSQDAVNQCLVPDVAAPGFCAEAVQHLRIQPDRNELPSVGADWRPPDTSHRATLAKERKPVAPAEHAFLIATLDVATAPWLPFSPTMSVLTSFLLTLRGRLRIRAVLLVELLALRHQIHVRERSRQRPAASCSC
jgi:hypothetical protein